MRKIEWGEPVDIGNGRICVRGHIADLVVAEVYPDRRRDGWWWVTVYLAPLPERLDALTYESKKSERQAKATAQRIVNAYLKILTTGETPRGGGS